MIVGFAGIGFIAYLRKRPRGNISLKAV
jgi:hypothetical protein